MPASQYTQTINHHGELLANIPAVMGFYPKNSVLITLFTADETHQELRLGPVTRLDLDSAVDDLRDNCDLFAAWFDKINAAASMIYIVADDVDNPYFDPRIKRLISFFGDVKVSPVSDVLAVTYTAQISTDEPWQALYRHETMSDMPLQGTISPLTSAAAMQHMINDTGQVPELDRDGIIDMLNSTDHGLDAKLHADILDSVKSYTVSDIPEALQCEYEQACSGRDEPHNPRAIRAGLKCFTTPRLRDPLLAALLEQPQQSFVFIQQLMRTVPVEWTALRSHITAVLALLAHATEQSGLASNAALHAVRIDDTVSLSTMVAQLTTLGKAAELVDITYKGAVQARNKLFDCDAA